MCLYEVPLSMSLLGLGMLLNVIEVLSGVGGALFARPRMVFQSMCVLCL